MKYKVLLSSRIFKEVEIEAENLERAEEIARRDLLDMETGLEDCDILPQDKYYWDKIEQVSAPEE